MEPIGLGNEIVECLRIGRMIERHAEQFLVRVYTDREIRFCQESRHTTEQFAGRWAAKQAVARSLGLRGVRGISWTEVEIRTDPEGRICVHLSGAARELAQRRLAGRFLLSVAYCKNYATATCIALRG